MSLCSLCQRHVSALCSVLPSTDIYLKDLRQIILQNYKCIVKPSKINCIHANEDIAMKQTANNPYVNSSLGDMFKLLAHTI